MKRTKAGVSLGAVVLVAAAVSVIVANASGDHRSYRGPGLTPANIAALSSPQTRARGVPDRVADLHFGDLSPTPGTVHALGAGALAWTLNGGRICVTQGLSAGCLAGVHKPIDIVVADDDVVGSGAPMRASGIATDEVESVAVVFPDGRARTGAVVGNFYDIELPSDIGPSSSYTVEARLKDGSTYSERVGP
jgi:hypothetical protein